MNILLTGASGFLGKNFILRAPDDWHILAVYNRNRDFEDFVKNCGRRHVTMARCDLTNRDEVQALFKAWGFDWECGLYLAAQVDLPGSVKDPIADWNVNVGGLLNFLNRARVHKFVFLSSGAVYDGLHGEVRPGMALSPTLPYAISKLASEQYIKCYHERHGTLQNYLIVRFFGAYGPYEPPHKIYTKLAKAFGTEKRKEFSVYGDGTNLIDAMYIDDAITALQLVLQGNASNMTFDLCCGSPTTIEDLVYAAARILGSNPVHIIKTGVAHECIRFYGSPAAFQSAFGFVPRIPLEEGLLRLADHLYAARVDNT